LRYTYVSDNVQLMQQDKLGILNKCVLHVLCVIDIVVPLIADIWKVMMNESTNNQCMNEVILHAQ